VLEGGGADAAVGSARGAGGLRADQLPRLRVADLLRTYGRAYLAERGAGACLAERRTLAELTACRTPALGSHTWRCDSCGHEHEAYNSCRNRHCPTCGGPARAAWLDRMLVDVLPVPYFHLVFTLPATLSTLVLANRSALYGLLFRAAWQALKELAADPEHLGASVGAVFVLHTWGQNLHHHPHVHGVVPGGGLSADGTRWVPSHSPKYLLCAKALSRKFRGKFLAGLKRLWRTGKLKLGGPLAGLADELAFERWLTPLYEQDWVVHIQPPPKSCQGPEAVLKYLARYVAGAAISDHRLVSHENGEVRFWGKNYRQGRKRQILPLSGVEFVRRWMVHVLPPGFVRVRYYGLLANTQRRAQVARCRQLLSSQGGAGEPCLPSRPAPPAALPADAAAPACPVCELGRLWLLRGCGRARPSRGEILFASPFAPPCPAAVVSPMVTVPAGQDSS